MWDCSAKGTAPAAGAECLRIPTDGEGRPLRRQAHGRFFIVFGYASRAQTELSR